MALIKCSECGKNVSSMAASCPHCGADVIQKEEVVENNQHNNLVINIFLFILLGLLTLHTILNWGDLVDLFQHNWNHERNFFLTFYYLSDLVFTVTVWFAMVYALTKKKVFRIVSFILMGVSILFGLIYLMWYIGNSFETYEALENNLSYAFGIFCSIIGLPTVTTLFALRK